MTKLNRTSYDSCCPHGPPRHWFYTLLQHRRKAMTSNFIVVRISSLLFHIAFVTVVPFPLPFSFITTPSSFQSSLIFFLALYLSFRYSKFGVIHFNYRYFHTGAISLGVKRSGRETDHSLVPRSRMRGAIPTLPQYVFMEWLLS